MSVLFFESYKKQVDEATGFRCRLVLGSREYFKHHYHDYYEVFLTLSDNVKHCVNDKMFELMRGDLVFMRPSDKHLFFFEGNEFMFLNFAFDNETYQSLKGYMKSNKFDELEAEQFPPVVNISDDQIKFIDSFYVKLNQIDVKDDAKKCTEFRVFLLKLFSNYFFDRKATKEEFREQIIEAPVWLAQFYSKLQKIEFFSLPFNELVNRSGKSKEHLSRSFKKVYGITLSDYQHKQRLNYVANKLVSSTNKVIDIFIEVGYEDISWANVLFKKRYGISPSQYRRENTI